MNGTRSISRWVPSALFVGGLLFAGLIYRDQVLEWFSAMESLRSDAASASTPIQTALAAKPHHDPGATAYYSCSMHPSVRAEEPGTCPICSMDLVPVTWGEIETGVITVDAEHRQLFGVKTDTVRREPLDKTIRAVGVIAPDETRLQDVTLKVNAWIGEVRADFQGKHVDRGDVLFTFYSPDVWSAQEEYLDAVKRAGSDDRRGRRFVEIAETRLRLWGLDDSTITAIRQRGAPIEYLPLRSPISGTVMEKTIVAGSSADAGQRLYRIADLSTVWLEAEVYESDLRLIQVGQPAQVTLATLSGAPLDGIIEYVYPYLNAQTRTVKIRVSVPNPAGALKPGMYANVNVPISLGDRLVVPESAILYAGNSRIAFVDLGEGRLQPRKVTIGARTEDLIEITDGLSPGETVVTSGNFLIAAESKLKSRIDQW